MIDDARLAWAKRVCDDATPGPWRLSRSAPPGVTYVNAQGVSPNLAKLHDASADGCGHHNAVFIAAARDLLPDLLAEVARLRARVTELEAAPRVLRCRCGAEIGDNGDCEAHPSCNACGEGKAKFGDECSKCDGYGRPRAVETA